MVGGDHRIQFPMMKDGCGWIEIIICMKVKPVLSIENSNESI
tara:strand:- start:885 stop:1010 length:126 start_codon:yes stop_codon:yes gene_type:complete